MKDRLTKSSFPFRCTTGHERRGDRETAALRTATSPTHSSIGDGFRRMSTSIPRRDRRTRDAKELEGC